ncbi:MULTISPECIES: PaaI family thioesterase [unclassified Gordonia (in: high G+C Gram-positive bacteria)]|uniref:PaaI family thioesterase n=1 Tax=unclassified Gordonia (in: high G+C Gram-positive bacteria) TaxID=2657482 RepID=UPI001F1035EE|nr:PaaI family thioesterase [Gordonia sp. ABSL49_1]MCH5644642.1 PaaI family thioesterase [Gordonia sp. ABSL49_1]
MEFTLEDISEDEVQRRREVYAPLADTVRELVDAVIRTQVSDDVIADARQRIAEVVAELQTDQIDGPYGVRYTREFTGMPWGNAVIGLRNAIAPPIVTELEPEGVRSTFTLGAAYEGPPGHVHGGVCAMILDHVLGEGASADKVPCYTGTITMRYLRPTPLGELVAQSWITERDGRKKIVHGTLSDANGVTVEADGVFIVPKTWNGTMPRAKKG